MPYNVTIEAPRLARGNNRVLPRLRHWLGSANSDRVQVTTNKSNSRETRRATSTARLATRKATLLLARKCATESLLRCPLRIFIQHQMHLQAALKREMSGLPTPLNVNERNAPKCCTGRSWIHGQRQATPVGSRRYGANSACEQKTRCPRPIDPPTGGRRKAPQKTCLRFEPEPCKCTCELPKNAGQNAQNA
jgi:hypothetical protein